MYKLIIRPLFFLFAPEKIHYWSMDLLSLLCRLKLSRALIKRLFNKGSEGLNTNVFGISFKNPIGLAAGFDKDARYLQALSCIGFGHVEVGTVTPLPQEGNPSPRLFRLPKDQGLINRMGFNNQGLEAMVERLKNRPAGLIVGGNIGKNKTTPNDLAKQDYITCTEALYPYVDYFVINVSSPNTPGLRELQEKEPLRQIIKSVIDTLESKNSTLPVLLKIAPDLTESQLDDILEIAEKEGLAGIICTNTTISRLSLKTDKSEIHSIGNGGLSGKPVKKSADEVLAYLSRNRPEGLELVGVGGVFTGKDAQNKMKSGASLVQVYTGFIYEGPSMVRNLCRYLASSNSLT